MKKKPNIFLFTILMIVVFFLITEVIIWGIGGTVLVTAVTGYPKGDLVISEAVLALLVLIVMLLFKNSYVFTQKMERFTTGLLYGLYYLIGASLFCVIYGRLYGGYSNIYSLINLFLGCFFIGVAEELLCRGWLLNEFLERYGDTKKGVWYSIILSGFIFGLMHISNIFISGQDVATTITQVVSAISTGIIFGVIYYKTKNIWSLIALHGLWDFSLMLGTIAPVTSNTEFIPVVSIFGVAMSIIVGLVELINLIPFAKDIDAEPRVGKIVACSITSFVLFFFLTIFTSLMSGEMGDTYEYDKLSLNNYSITVDNFNSYYIKGEYNYELTYNGNLVFRNINTGYSVNLDFEELYDYIIVENEDYYVLAYVDYTDSSNAYLKYIYIYKKDLSDDKPFMDNVKNSISKHLISERSIIREIYDRDRDTKYVSAYSTDYGYYVLVGPDNVSILEQ